MRRPETIRRSIARYEQRYLDRVHRGRTRGAGAGGFVRDLDNIRHCIRVDMNELAASLAHEALKAERKAAAQPSTTQPKA